MKTFLLLKLVALGLFLSFTSQAQFIEYGRDTKWNIGINAGGVWQDADIDLDRPGFGYGFTFGRSIYEKPNAFWGLDLRFRYLRGKTYGLDPERILLDSTQAPDFGKYADSVGYTYLNNKTDVHDYSLEAVIRFNRLRDRTGILFHIFGGIGVTNYQTKYDLFQDSTGIYDYSGLPVNGDTPEPGHESLLDGDYESDAPTHGDRKIEFMPSLGIGLGYQITPAVSIGVEHRATFVLNDLFDGYEAPGSEFINLENGRDIYHYTALNLRWNILRGKIADDVEDVDPYNPCDKPYAQFSSPRENEVFENPSINVSAQVSRINGNNDIVLKVNGKPFTTQYSLSTELVTANVNLVKGTNRIEIITSNSCGQTIITRTVEYKPFECPVPVIQISSPLGGVVSTNTVNLNASALEVGPKGRITVTVNGVTTAVNYNSATGTLSGVLSLEEGNNTIIVKATNECGEDIKTINVLYKDEPCVNPLVSISSPINRSRVTNPLINLNARISNLKLASQARVTLNGQIIPSTFGVSNGNLNASLNLRVGLNTIVVYGQNECGQDQQSITVVLEEDEVPCLVPVITINSPINGSKTFNSTITLNARITNLTFANQARVTVNGQQITNSYSTSSGNLTALINLQNGVNNINIYGQNACGQTQDAVMIILEEEQQPCLVPSVSIASPINGSRVSTPVINLGANIINVANANQVRATLNGRAIVSTYNTASRSLTGVLNLREGTNTINVIAQNECGQDQKTITVTYEKLPCLAPVISVLSPANGLVINQGSVALTANVLNISSNIGVKCKVNGVVVASTFNRSNSTLSASVNLQKGNNIIEVVATNACGTVSKTVSVAYECPVPSVNIFTPATGVKVTTNTISLTGVVQGTTNRNEIFVRLNGSSATYSLNRLNGSISAQLTLKEGINTVELSAVNVCGNDKKTISVTYEKPCAKPTVLISKPLANQNFSIAASELKAVINNVTNKNQVTVKLNGVNAMFNLIGNQLNAMLTLKKGLNTIVVTASNTCGVDSQTVQVTYDAPCPKPGVSIVSPLAGAVVKAKQQTITGAVSNITASNQIQAKVNGVFKTVTLSGATFTFTADLAVGNNTIEVTATNSCGNEKKTINVTFECDKPIISIGSPVNASVLTSANVLINGVAQNTSSQAQVVIKVNGVSQTFNYNSKSHIFNLQAALKEGSNTITISATNDCGTVTKTVSVTYNKPCNKPTLTLLTPANHSSFVKGASLDYGFTAKNISSKSQIVITLNKVPVTNYTFNASSGMINGTAPLLVGENNLVVTIKNECGTASDRLIVTRLKPCVKPTISITNPKDGFSTLNTSVPFTAKLTDIKNKSEIAMLINNVPYIGFSFNATTGVVSGTIALKNGANTVEVEVKNACGEGRARITINKTIPCDKPAVSIGSPINGAVLNSSTIQINGVARYTSQAQLTVKVNGIAKTFSYNSKSNIFNLQAALKSGTNTIEVIAATDCGNSTKAVTVTYKAPCVKPLIENLSPSNGTTTANGSQVFSAQLVNISSRNEIAILVNNVPYNGFQFNTTTGIVSGTATLANGANTIEIEVKNACGEGRARITINKMAPCDAPVVSIGSPANGAVLTSPSVQINGVARYTSQAQLTVKVNGVAKTFTYNSKSNIYNLQGVLKTGNNTIEVIAATDCGNSTKTANVTYKEPCDLPVVSIGSPANGAVLTSPTVLINGVARYTSQTQLTVKVNGVAKTFTYNSKSNIYNLQGALKAGTNTIEVIAATTCGQSSKKVSVTYNKPCVKPTVIITSPRAGQTYQNKVVPFSANVTGVKSSRDITVKLNNKVVKHTLRGKTIIASITTAINGKNTLVVQARNSCGNTLATSIFNYKIIKPTVSITSHKNKQTLNPGSIKLGGSILSGGSNPKVSITLNKKPFKTSVSIKKEKNGSISFSAPVTIMNGTNTIQVTVVNDYGHSTTQLITLVGKKVINTIKATPTNIKSTPIKTGGVKPAGGFKKN